MELFSKSVKAKSKLYTIICILYLIFNGCMGFPIVNDDLFGIILSVIIFICISAFFACLFPDNPIKTFLYSFISNALGFIIRIIMQLSGIIDCKNYNLFTSIVLLFFVPLFVFVFYILFRNTLKNQIEN